MERCDLLIKNAYVLTMNDQRQVFPRGAIAIKGRRIAAVGPERLVAPQFAPERTIDANGAPVHPGFVETHVHLMHTIRGAFPDVFQNYSEGVQRFARWWDALTDEDEYAGSLLTCIEMLHNGTTCFAEAGTIFEPDVAALAMEKVGIRGVLADPFLWDRLSLPPVDRAPANLDRCLKLMGGQLKRNRNADSLVRGYVALYGVASASDELERAGKACADENAAIMAQHQSFVATDTDDDTRRFGEPPLVHFEKLGILGSNCLMFHLNHIRAEEVRAIEASRMSVAWCPAASMVSGSGGTFHGCHSELYRRGVNVALGSDSATLGYRFDVGLMGFLAVLTARERLGDRQALNSEDALIMATINGARALGMDKEIGSLEPGKKADIVIRTMDVPEAIPGINVAQSLIFSAGSRSVDTVLVDGSIVVLKGRCTQVDESHAFLEARQVTRRMTDRLGIRPEPRWPHIE